MSYIVYYDGKEKKFLKLKKDANLTIGRSQDNYLRLPDNGKISRQHCMIYYYPEKNCFVLSDLSSTNGTLLNKNRISSDVILSNNDSIEIGDSIVQFFEDDELASNENLVDSIQSSQPYNINDIDEDDLVQTFQKLSTEYFRSQLQQKDQQLLKPTENIGNYQIVRKIGSGQLSSVYLAKYSNLQRVFAVKLFTPELKNPEAISALADIASSTDFKISSFINYFDSGTHNSHGYISMDYLPNGNLVARIARSAPFSEVFCLETLLQIAKSLDFYFSRFQAPYRNLKPANILFSSNDDMVISDYSTCDWVSRYLLDGASAASPQYISPEQINGKVTNWQCDLYSLGIIFFEMLAGQLPYRAVDKDELFELHLENNFPVPEERNPNIIVSDESISILKTMIAKNPLDRFKSWTETIDSIRVALENNKRESRQLKPFLPKKALEFSPDLKKSFKMTRTKNKWKR